MALECPQEGLDQLPAVLHVGGPTPGWGRGGEGRSLHASDLNVSRNTCPLVNEFQGVAHVALREPHNLAGEAAFCYCDGRLFDTQGNPPR